MTEGKSIAQTVFSSADTAFMQLALAQAAAAAAQGEVPVGAVMVIDGVVASAAHNQPIATHDPSAHAEMLALRAACAAAQNYRLPDATVYVTLEPCLMCLGAMFGARINRIVYAASDEKTGACGGAIDLSSHEKLNHHTRIEGGLLKDESVNLLQVFFKQRRAAVKLAKIAG